MLSSEPGTIATGLADRLQQRGIIGGSRARAGTMCREQYLVAKRLRCLGAVQTVARHRGGDRAAHHALQGIGDRRSGDCTGSMLQRREQGRDGPGGDQGSCGVVYQHDVGSQRLQRFQPSQHAILAAGAASYRPQVRKSGQGSLDRRRVADRLQQCHMRGQGLGGMAYHRLAGKPQILLGCLAAEPAAGPGCHEDRCCTHDVTVAVRRVGVNGGPGSNGSRERLSHSWNSEHTHCTLAYVSVICPNDEHVSLRHHSFCAGTAAY